MRKYATVIIGLLVASCSNKSEQNSTNETSKKQLGFTDITSNRFNGNIESTTSTFYHINLSENGEINIIDSINGKHTSHYNTNGYVSQSRRYTFTGDTFSKINFKMTDGVPTMSVNYQNDGVQDTATISHPSSLTSVSTSNTIYPGGSFYKSENTSEYNQDGSYKEQIIKNFYTDKSKGYTTTRTTYEYSGDTTTITTNVELTGEINKTLIIFKDKDAHGNPKKCIHYNPQNKSYVLQVIEYKYY